MRTLVLLALSALILAAGTVALWSGGTTTRVRFDDAHLLYYLTSPTQADAVAEPLQRAGAGG